MPTKRSSPRVPKRGVEFEKRVERWLKRQGFETKTRLPVRGKVSRRPYEVDVYAAKKPSLLSKRVHIWVECKDTKRPVKRMDIMKLVEAAKDVARAWRKGIEEWRPDILMVVSRSGFDVDAIEFANKYRIYCVFAKDYGFEFVGLMSREKFNNLVGSNYF